jgi:hypothetical protein
VGAIKRAVTAPIAAPIIVASGRANLTRLLVLKMRIISPIIQESCKKAAHHPSLGAFKLSATVQALADSVMSVCCSFNRVIREKDKYSANYSNQQTGKI